MIGNGAIGGLVGSNGFTVSNSYSTGDVAGSYDIGGLMGINDQGTVSNSFWDTQTSGQSTSAGGEGKTTAEMKTIATFSGAAWNIIAVAGPGERDAAYIWNIINGVAYPFLSWQPVSQSSWTLGIGGLRFEFVQGDYRNLEVKHEDST
jgi:hypothetical protein